jgi:hypothetical protein
VLNDKQHAVNGWEQRLAMGDGSGLCSVVAHDLRHPSKQARVQEESMTELINVLCLRPDGEAFLLRRTSDYVWLCPVCAERSPGEAPYDQDARYGSQDICPRCKTQYGHDDFACGAETVQSKWKRLRFDWLKKEAWPFDALQRLEKDLKIDIARLQEDAMNYYRQSAE